MEKFWHKYWDEVVVYLVTFAGVIMAQYRPYFQDGEEVTFRWAFVFFGAFVALALTAVLERRGGPLTPEKQAGKQRNFLVRLGFGWLLGFGWQYVMETIFAMVKGMIG